MFASSSATNDEVFQPTTPTSLPAYDTDLPSPCFVVNQRIARQNTQRIIHLCKDQKLALRPHMKTHKTKEGAALQTAHTDHDDAKIIVSTLAEAEFYASSEGGLYNDILYAIPIEPSKFPRIFALHCRIPSFHIMVDSYEAVDAIETFLNHQLSSLLATESNTSSSSSSSSSSAMENYYHANRRFSVFLAIDSSGYHREGIDVTTDEGKDLGINLAKRIQTSRRLKFTGIYSHSGNSYNCGTCLSSSIPIDHYDTGKLTSVTPAWNDARKGASMIAVSEKDVMVQFAQTLLNEAQIEVPYVSLGATPSVSSHIQWNSPSTLPSSSSLLSPSSPNQLSLTTPTIELHPGNYIFYDRQQVISGSCTVNDIAVYVLARIIATYPTRNEFLIDCGSCALHKDPAGLPDHTWGCLLENTNLVLKKMTQEIATVTTLDGSSIDWLTYRYGTVVRVLPNHACMTAACHDIYYVVDDDNDDDKDNDKDNNNQETIKNKGNGANQDSSIRPRKVTGTWKPCKFW